MMKFNKKLCAFSVAAVMSLSVCAPAFAAEGENAVDLQYNGVTTEDAAILVNDTTYMSAEDVKAVLGVDCAVADGKAQLTVGSEAVEVETVDGLIPVRAIANALGYSIGWDSEAKTAIVIDVDKLAASETFDIMGKYMDYNLSMEMPYAQNGEFDGVYEMTDADSTFTIPFNGDVVSLVSADGEDMTMNLTIDFSQFEELLTAQGMDENEQQAFDAVVAALGSSETKILYNIKENVMYLNSSMFTVFGLDANAWLSIDLGDIFGMATTEGAADLTAILENAMSGDLKAYIVDLLKAIPVEDVNSYAALEEAYGVYSAMLGDSAFVLEDGKYTLNYAMNQDGADFTYSIVLGTEGETVNSCDIAMKVAAEGVSMDVTAASDKDFNTTMTLAMNIADMIKMNFNYKATVSASTEAPQLTVPEGATVLSLTDLLFGTMTEDAVIDVTADENAAEVPAEEEPAAEVPAEKEPAAEVPAETTETADETAAAEVPAETTEVPAEKVETSETAEEIVAA